MWTIGKFNDIYIDKSPFIIYNVYQNKVQGNISLYIAFTFRLMEQFRENLKKLRRIKGWAQEDLAQEVDVSLSTVQRWEGKGAKPIRHARKKLDELLREAGINPKE